MIQLQRVEQPDATREESEPAMSRGESCIGCGATEQVGAGAGGYDEYCSRCAHTHQMGDLAVDNLAKQIAALIPAWKAYWVGQGAEPQYLREILEPTEQALLNGYMRPVITEAFKRG